MTIEGEYEPSPWDWVRDQVERVRALRRPGRGHAAGTPGCPIIIITTRGNKTGKLRKTALMRVEHDGEYAARRVDGRRPEESRSGTTTSRPIPTSTIQDGPEPFDARVRELTGDERARVVGPRGRRVPALRGVPVEHRHA